VTYLIQQIAWFLLGTAAFFFALAWYLARRRGRILLQEMEDAWSAKHLALIQTFDKLRIENENALSVSMTADNLIESAQSRAGRLEVEVEELRSRVRELEAEARRRPPADDRDDLKKIRGIGLVLEKKLNSLGVLHYRQIAAWTDSDTKRMAEHLAGFPDRIARDKWVEHAAEEHFHKYGEVIEKAAASAV
jgi:predicted flap endonuclease-1-like 5' DNA nuclease